MIIPTTQSTSTLKVGHASDLGYISLWQDLDLVIVHPDQVDALIEELKKFKENA
jgi:hypothetical protein